MKERTQQYLQALANLELFHAVGAGPLPFAAKTLPSWKAAFDKKRRFDWENVQMQAAGDRTAQLSKHHRDRYAQWNPLVRAIRPHVEKVVDPKCEDAMERHGLPAGLGQSVRWDCLHACMEYEFEDIVPVGFYDRLQIVYFAGRFPCGWEGEYPAGLLEVY